MPIFFLCHEPVHVTCMKWNFNVMVISFHVLFCVSRHQMPWHYQHKHCILFLFSSWCLILTLQRRSILLNNSLYSDICVFISTLFSDTLNQCSSLWFREQYQVWSFHRGKTHSVVFRAMASCIPGAVVPTFWRSMLPSPVVNLKAVCLSKTWIPLYQIRSVISQKTRLWICMDRWNFVPIDNLGHITRKK